MDFKTSRRQVISYSLQFLAIQIFFQNKIFANIKNEKKYLIAGTDNKLFSVNLGTFSINKISVPIIPHSFIQNPKNTQQIVSLEKLGTKAVVFDCIFGSVIKEITSEKNTLFYGHGVYSSDGRYLYLTNVNTGGEGELVAYETKEYTKDHSLKITAGGLHDCHFTKSGTLLVTSSGLQISKKVGNKVYVEKERIEKSALVEVDLVSKKIIRKIEIDDVDQVIGHFYQIKNDDIVAITIPFKDKILNNTETGRGQIYYSKNGQGFNKVPYPNQLQNKIKGEILSLAVDEKNDRFFVTNPTSKTVMVFKLTNQKFLKSFDLPMNGVSLFEENLILSPTDSNNKIISMNLNKLSINTKNNEFEKIITKLNISSPHISIFDI